MRDRKDAVLTRRRFIQSGLAMTAGSGFLPLEDPCPLAGGGEGHGYRALVCIFLAGGNDSFNMLVPADHDQYARYSAARGNLALRDEHLLPLTGHDRSGRRYAMHSSMRGIHSLYKDGHAACIASVGASLGSEFASSGTSVDVFSHSSQIMQSQTCLRGVNSSSGWGGRIADILCGQPGRSRLPLNLSLSGDNVFQLGRRTSPGSMATSWVPAEYGRRSTASVDFDYVNEKMAKRIGERKRSGHRFDRRRIESAGTGRVLEELASVIREGPKLVAEFSPDPFSQDLAHVAQIIAARHIHKRKRQIFYVSLNGWDHHHDLLGLHAEMLTRLSEGLSSFVDALKEMDVFESVTTFTSSEFGRSLSSNGTGSDHGWSGHQIVVGGAVAGGAVYGDYPELARANPLNIGNGVYAPTTSNDEYFSELSQWLGLPPSGLAYVFPDLRRILPGDVNERPIGFLSR